MDTYKEVKVINLAGMVARVHIPDLTPEERAKRINYIHKQAAELMKGVK